MTGVAWRAGARGGTLTLLRHGQSEWNRARRFTGWADVDLTATGVREAVHAGERLRAAGCAFDCCFTSALRRARRTAALALDALGMRDVPVEATWRLNERHYGALQGLDLYGAVRRYGIVPVLRVRRQAGYRPPVDGRVYAGAGTARAAAPAAPAALDAGAAPDGESLADMRARLLAFWQARIVPELARGRRVLVVSHHHPLRALLATLGAAGGRVRVQTGVPIVLGLDAALAVVERRVLDGRGWPRPAARGPGAERRP